jgi:hypothetical protein
MGLAYVGEISLADLCPLVLTATGPLVTQLQAKLTGLLQLTARLKVTPPKVAASLQLAVQMVSALTAAVVVTPPGIDFQAVGIAKVLAQVQDNLGILVLLAGILNTEAFVFVYDGPTTAFGPALTTALAPGWPDGTPPATEAHAIVIGGVSPLTIAALKKFFGGAS